MKIDLNADLGEGFPHDIALLDLVSTANIACGVYAGSPELSLTIALAAQQRGVRAAAHVGYPDREGFGRRSISDLPEGWWLPQLALFPHAVVKPHGALYGDLTRGMWPEMVFHQPIIGLAAHAGRGTRLIREGFAERGYANGELLPRDAPGALLHDLAAAAAQALRLAPMVDTICIHGDSPNALAIALAVRRALEAAGWTIGA